MPIAMMMTIMSPSYQMVYTIVKSYEGITFIPYI